MKIRRRLALFGMAVTSAALLAFALLLNLMVGGGVRQDQDAMLAEMAAAAVTSLESAGADSFAVGRPPVVTDPVTSDQPFIVVADPSGTVLYSEALVGGQPPRLPAALIVEALEEGRSTATVDGIRYQAASFEHPSIGEGVVAAGQSTRVPEEQLGGFRAFLIIFAVITVAGAAVVSWLVSGRALRPLKALAATADEISTTGDLSRRLPPSRAEDEVAALTASFNGMLERLEETRSRLEKTLDAQRRFVADASHELRSPLTTIRSNAGFLAERPDAEEPDRREALADIQSEADRMARLVDGLLALARHDAGQELTLEPVPLETVVREVVRRDRPRHDSLVVEVVDPAVVVGDVEALGRVVRILFDNADVHAGGVRQARIWSEDGVGVLAVADEGPGIVPGEEEAIFERFRRGSSARGGTGSGLGLAIARSIVTEMGGSIAGRNREGSGAIFEVRLPLA